MFVKVILHVKSNVFNSLSSDVRLRRLFYGVDLRRRLFVYANAYAVTFENFYVMRLRHRLFFRMSVERIFLSVSNRVFVPTSNKRYIVQYLVLALSLLFFEAYKGGNRSWKLLVIVCKHKRSSQARCECFARVFILMEQWRELKKRSFKLGRWK